MKLNTMIEVQLVEQVSCFRHLGSILLEDRYFKYDIKGRKPLCITRNYLQETLITARRIARAVLATAIPSVRHTPVLCQNDGT